MWVLLYQIIKNPIFSIVCALGGFLAGHRLALGRERINEFNKAAATFRDAFVEEIRLLSKDRGRRPSWGSSENNKTAYDIVESVISKHESAYISFRHYISRSKRKGFDLAWYQYAEPNKDTVPSKPFIEYDSLGEPQKEKELKKMVLHRIEILLNYAKPK